MSDRLDIVLFGASGFTGSYCITSLQRLTKCNGLALTWGIAGRSEDKIKEVLEEIQETLGIDVSPVPIIIADVNDYESLKIMTARAKVLINVCGPYRFFGEPVIKACLETGTHQVDVAGEPQYMETIQYNYHKAAQEKGIYIVSSCGFDSIPADLGVVFLQQKFEGTVNSVETYLQLIGGGDGARANYATYESAVYGMATAKELGQLRRKLYPTPLPKFRPTLKLRPPVHKSEVINTWSIPFIGADRSVIVRTQRYLFDSKKFRPAQAQAYFGIKSIVNLIVMIIYGTLFGFLAKYEFGRKLLLNNPSIFTAGHIKRAPPSREDHKNSKFVMTVKGVGWNEKLADVADEFTTPPDKTMVVRVSSDDPAYGLTADAVTLSAITILTESKKLPKGGGVYTPGAAFADTSLIEKLQEHGCKFEVL